MCEQNKMVFGDTISGDALTVITEEAKKYVTLPEHVNALVEAGLRALMQNLVSKMIVELLRENKIQELNASDLVNCISKIMKLLPANISQPMAAELCKKLNGAVDLNELTVTTDQTNPSELPLK